MNASRLLEIVQLIDGVEKAYQTQEALNNVFSAIRGLVSQPSQATYQSEFAAALEVLRKLMDDVRDKFQPAQVKILEEIGAAEFFTDDLVSEISGWVSKNVATPAVAQEKLSNLISDREAYLAEIRQLSNNLQRVGVEVNELEFGQAEIGFLLPRELFNNHLDDLIKELDVVKKVIRAFSEAATGSVEPIEVRQISTSDPLFFFGLNLETIVLIGGAVTWALNSWRQVEDIRKVRAETEKIAAFKDDPIEELFANKIKSQVEIAVAEKTREIVSKITGNQPRKNEQENQIKWALESIISRVERGMTVEIRLLPSPVSEADMESETEEIVDRSDQLTGYNALNEIASQLIFPKMVGEPVLQIPPAEPVANKRSSPKQ